MKAAVEANGLGKTFTVQSGGFFSRRERTVLAVDDISFSVPEGQSLAFIGPNGAGKSTTIKILSGILSPSKGNASVLGLTPWKERRKLAGQVGAVFGQRSQLWLHLPPRDTFDLLASIYSLPRAEYMKQKKMLVERFELGEFMDVPVRKLSLGQRMRAEIAASLLHRPRLLFLDEPTIGIDVVARRELRDLIRQWNRDDGLTIFLTSHDAGDIEAVSDRVIVVNHGKLALDGTVGEIKKDVLRSRIIDIKLSRSSDYIPGPGVKVLAHDTYSIRLEVDCNARGVENVVSELLTQCEVVDINIESPPLEDVIAHLFSKNKEVISKHG